MDGNYYAAFGVYGPKVVKSILSRNKESFLSIEERVRYLFCLFSHFSLTPALSLSLPLPIPPPSPSPSPSPSPGSNKVAFLISHYTPPQTAPPLPPSSSATPPLLSPPLKTRLSRQPALAEYLERGHVISWCDSPDIGHIGRLVEIAKLEPNPQGILSTCSVM